jgi:hypothetical protein
MVIRRWVVACLALGFLFSVLADIATLRAHLNLLPADATSTTKTAGHNVPDLVVRDDGPDDDSLALAPEVDDESDGDDWPEDNPFGG